PLHILMQGILRLDLLHKFTLMQVRKIGKNHMMGIKNKLMQALKHDFSLGIYMDIISLPGSLVY
ncbi:hypothetical protein ACJX0J_030626, partial [Zea mays]